MHSSAHETATQVEQKHGEQFLDALAARDFDRIERMFHERAQFRGLTPSALREGHTAAEAAGWLHKWLSDATEFDMIESSVDSVVDKLNVRYRIRVKENDEWFIVEQHAYCTIEDNQITTLDLVCSGFRPVDAP